MLVTGSTSGIGRDVARMCAREGARVAVHGRNVARGEVVVQEIAAAGGTAAFFAADVADEAACNALVDDVATRFGGLTVLVNNAAAGTGGNSVSWSLTNDPQYATGSYSATATFTISAT